MAKVILKRFPTRVTIWLMCFTCTFFLYMLRINLSIIILAMVEPAKIKDNNGTVFVPECKRTAANFSQENIAAAAAETHVSAPDYGTRYSWDNKLQGLMLGSYFWGFTAAGIPGGALAERFGPARCVTVSFAASALLTVAAPAAAALHPALLMAARFFVGLFGGVVFPSLHCLVARWAPPHEKGKFVGALLGGSLGAVATWPLLGVVIEKWGWPWAFYGSGVLVLLWTGLWGGLVADAPQNHRRISPEERDYIVDSLKGRFAEKKTLPPYKKIAASVPFWALLTLHFGNLWGLFFLMTAGPNFLSSVLGFTLGHTGVMASLPYLARLVCGISFGQIGDFLLRKNWMTKIAIRKTFLLFSHILPGVLLFGQTLSGCDVTWSIILMTSSLGMNGASTLTNLQNAQDLAPNFAGTLYGIVNCVGSTAGFINPTIVGYVTARNNGLNEWRTIFYIGSSVYVASGVVFFIFGSAETQRWNDAENNKKKKKKNIEEEEEEGIENIGFDVDDAENNKKNNRNNVLTENTKI